MRALLSLLELEYLVGRESQSCKNLSNSNGPRMDLWVQESTRIVVLIFGAILIKIKYLPKNEKN